MALRRLSEPQNQLYEFVDTLLWEEWDPIGVNDVAPNDEYQAYALPISSLAIRGATSHEIADKLLEFEREKMGFDGDGLKCIEIARKIFEETKRLALA